MYEIIKNIRFIERVSSEGKACVMATIVRTEGSSYRKKWTQMVVAEDMSYEGALSGGCVEREVLRQSSKLFFTKGNAVFEYDGTETLGCKGRIWVALEYINQKCIQDLISIIKKAHQNRVDIEQGIVSDEVPQTFFKRDKKIVVINGSIPMDISEADIRIVKPQNRMVIVGGEFDSFILARMSQLSGFDVHMIVYKDFVKPSYTPSYKVLRCPPEKIERSFSWDDRTILILMTHSMNKDFQYLSNVLNQEIAYIGALGPLNRREELIEKCKKEIPDINDKGKNNLANLRGPVGIDIEAQTPEEIAISILAEIIQVINKQ